MKKKGKEIASAGEVEYLTPGRLFGVANGGEMGVKWGYKNK